MNTFLKSYLLRYEAVIIIIPLITFLFWPHLIANLFTSTYMPHGHCYLWMPELVLLHVSSDLVIGISYVLIAASLAFLVYKASSDIPFHRMFLAFGLFIISCGFTHFMSVWNVYEAIYWLSGSVKVITAVASALTAFSLPFFIPKTLEMIRDAKLSDERKQQLESAINELADLNKKLKEVDKLKTDFFTNVSHELRTPLSLILGPSEKLLSEISMPAQYKNDLIVIQKNARVLLKHVNDLLDVSRIESGQMKLQYVNLNMTELVRFTASYFESIANEQGITLKFNLPDNLYIEADQGKMERILVNLISNAFKYTPRGGVIEFKLSQDNEFAVFSISDTGPGIDELIQKQLFDRFSQSLKGLNLRLGSSGLGLSIVKEFIELHEGHIFANNLTQGGAEFVFMIPIQAPSKVQLYKEPANEEINTDYKNAVEELRSSLQEKSSYVPNKENEETIVEKKPLILVVEDNIEMSNFLVQNLENNYEVHTAINGEDGFEKALKLKPDLILSDIMMPKVTGEKMLEKIRDVKALDSTPVVMLTAKTDEEMKLVLLNNGAQDYLMKPFTVAELKARIGNLVRTKVAVDILQNELKLNNNNITVLVNEAANRKHLIEESLKEKEVLLREIHHRVKNNLQIISSLLNLQADTIKDSPALTIFNDSRDRIRSIALVHEYLYKTTELSEINFSDYVRELITSLYSVYASGGLEIDFRYETENAVIDIDKAIPLGLISNEIITNALKHAFPPEFISPTKEIFISAKVIGKDLKFTIKDNGIGLPPGKDLSHSNSLGMLLIRTLVDQIDGRLSIDSKNGLAYTITFYK